MTIRSIPALSNCRISLPMLSAARGTGISPTTMSSPTTPIVMDGAPAWTSASVSPKASMLRATSGCAGAYNWTARMRRGEPAEKLFGDLGLLRRAHVC